MDADLPLSKQELARFCGRCGSAEGWDALRPEFCAVCWDTRTRLPIEVTQHINALQASLLAAQEALRQVREERRLRALMHRVPTNRPHIYASTRDEWEAVNERLGALLGVSAEPRKDTERATASQSPGQQGWSNVPVAKTGVGANVYWGPATAEPPAEAEPEHEFVVRQDGHLFTAWCSCDGWETMGWTREENARRGHEWHIEEVEAGLPVEPGEAT